MKVFVTIMNKYHTSATIETESDEFNKVFDIYAEDLSKKRHGPKPIGYMMEKQHRYLWMRNIFNSDT